MRLEIHHQTRYRFTRAVDLQSHRLLVTPRSGAELQLLDIRINAGSDTTIEWTDDVFANRIANVSFRLPTQELLIDVISRVDQTASAFPIFAIGVEAHNYPFDYSDDDRLDLGALLDARLSDDVTEDNQVANWARGFIAGQPTDTLALLGDINAGILNAVAYRARDEAGTQTPAETLKLASGSCRDIAALFIASVRHLGFGARAVSGYLYDPEASTDDPGSTHAWAEVFLPGAGWIAFDPTHRRMGGAFLIPVAVGRHNARIMPVAGAYVGSAADAAGMEVSVKIALSSNDAS